MLPGITQLILSGLNFDVLYYSSPPYRLAEFLIGITLAVGWQKRLLEIKHPAVIISGLVLFCVGCYVFNGMDSANLSLLKLVSVPFMAVLISYAASARPWLLERRAFAYLGNISYGFYMFQFVFLVYALPILKENVRQPELIALIGFAMTLCLAVFSHHVLEEPLRQKIKALWFLYSGRSLSTALVTKNML